MNSPTFDHADTAFAADAYANIAALREACPVLHSPRHGGFHALTSYSDVAVAANEYGRFIAAPGITLPAMPLPVRSVPLESDPPEHGLYRRVLQPFFTTPQVSAMEDLVRAVVVEHIEAFADAGRADFVGQLANPVPSIVLAMLLGMERRSWPQLKDVNSRAQDAAMAGDHDAAMQAGMELGGIVMRECEDRRAHPRDDLISTIVHARVNDEPIDPTIAFAMVQILVVAGFDTTVYGIGTLLRILATDAELQMRVRAGDKELRNRVIEESLRIDSPVFGLARTAAVDTELSGCPIPKGSRVLLCFGGANHDPEVFPEPEVFDPDRGNVAKHLAFGSGRHRCIGEPLAKLQIRIVLDELIDRIPPFAVEQDKDVLFRYGMTRGPLSLPVAW